MKRALTRSFWIPLVAGAAGCMPLVTPAQPPQLPSVDRTVEFTATCTDIWRSELGRPAPYIDAEALAACMARAKAGETGDQIRASVHDSAEAVTYRSRPTTPPTPRVHVDGLRFVTEAGDEWTMAFTDGFRDYERLLKQGPDALRPLLKEAQELGGNGRRVLGAFDFGSPEAQHLYPREHPDYYDRIPELFALYREYGLYGQFCVFADTQRAVPGAAAQQTHWTRVCAALQPIPNVLSQRVNEGNQHENGVEADVQPCPGVLSSYGSNGTGDDPPRPFWQYADLGSERRDGRMPLSTTTVFFAKFGYGGEGNAAGFPGTRIPTVVSEPPKLGVHITTTQDAYLLGLGTQWGNGGTAHSQSALMSLPLSDTERELTRAFLRGVKAR